MQFHFQLEGLLHVRRLLEQQARQRLDESMMRIHALDQNLALAMVWSERTARTCMPKKELPAAEVQFIECVLRQTREGIARCRRQKLAEEQRAVQLRAAYLEARRDRKTVSTLRDRALRQFEVEESRREQNDLDEIFLGKLVRSQNNAHLPSGLASPESNP